VSAAVAAAAAWGDSWPVLGTASSLPHHGAVSFSRSAAAPAGTHPRSTLLQQTVLSLCLCPPPAG
jgi:hypothetical protein